MRKVLRFLISLILSKLYYKFFIKDLFTKKKLLHINKFFDILYFADKIIPIELRVPKNKNILIIIPHPDDELLGLGGLILLANKQKCKFKIICLSSGDIIEKASRELELKKVCKNIKIKDIEFKRFKDGNLANDLENNSFINSSIKNFKPDIILTPFLLDNHKDHSAANKIFINLHKKFYSTLNTEVWSYQVYTSIMANTFLNISKVAKKKYSLLKLYKSQNKNFDYINWNKGLNSWNSRLANNKKIKFVELFFILPLSEYIKICKSFFRNE
jgi:LmbE family N-acetylglucosaminyl deacetylase